MLLLIYRKRVKKAQARSVFAFILSVTMAVQRECPTKPLVPFMWIFMYLWHKMALIPPCVCEREYDLVFLQRWINLQLAPHPIRTIFLVCDDEKKFRGDWFGTFNLYEACDNSLQQSRDTEPLKKYNQISSHGKGTPHANDVRCNKARKRTTNWSIQNSFEWISTE